MTYKDHINNEAGKSSHRTPNIGQGMETIVVLLYQESKDNSILHKDRSKSKTWTGR